MKRIHIGYIFVLALTLAARGRSESTLDDVDLDDFPMDGDRTPADGGETDEDAGNLSDVEFLEEEPSVGVASSQHQPSEQKMLAVIASAMRRPGMRRQLGQVLPILRSMSPTQRLALAAMLTSRLGTAGGGGISSQQLVNMLGAAQQEELLLPLSMDIANMFQPASPRPEALGLRHQRGPAPIPRLRDLHLASRTRPPTPPPPGHNRRNALVQTEMVPPPPPKRSPPPHATKRRRPPSTGKPQPVSTSPAREQHLARPPPHHLAGDESKSPAEDECDFFTNTLCLEVTDYPDDAIIASIHRNQGAVQALLADYTPSAESEAEHRYVASRRQDVVGVEAGALCPSMVKHARPKRARATSGQWKFVVNVGDYTQTLRLEMCMKPRESCSFISENFRSTCSQVFNYHRLLTWDDTRGLHMDIFKVPTCCSCHIQGYAFNFPPRGSDPQHDASSLHEEFPGADFASSDDRTPLQHVPFRQESAGGANNVHNTFEDSNFRQETGGFQNSFEDSNFRQETDGFGQNSFQDAGGVGFQNSFEDSSNFRRPFDTISSSFQETTLFHGATQDQDLRGAVAQPPRRIPKPANPQNFQRQGFRRPTSEHLTPPHAPPLPLAFENDFPPFAGNQLRRSRNQTASAPATASRPVHQDLEFGASSPQLRPHPHTISSDSIRSKLSTTTTSRPTSTAAAPTSSTDAAHRRVNYSYHPIIDFFKSAQEPSKLEARKGQEWTPIVGDSQPRAAPTK